MNYCKTNVLDRYNVLRRCNRHNPYHHRTRRYGKYIGHSCNGIAGLYNLYQVAKTVLFSALLYVVVVEASMMALFYAMVELLALDEICCTCDKNYRDAILGLIKIACTILER